MRRRLLLAIAGTVLATLLTVGLGTFLLNRLGARQESRDLLAERLDGLVALVTSLPGANDGALPASGQLRAIAGALRVSDAGVVIVNRSGVITRQDLPAGVELEELPWRTVQPGEVVTGDSGRQVWALTVRAVGPARVIVVLSDDVSTGVGPAGRWFVLASIGSLLAGGVVAMVLARRWAEPLREARDTTARIAAGDLTARVPAHATDDRTEVGDLSRAINQMAERLEQSRGVERQFLLSVSHDLRTPLTSIRGYAEAINDGAVDDPSRAAGVILSESRRLERLVQDLLDLARLESHRFTLHPQPIDLVELVDDVVSGFTHRAAERGVVIDTGLAPLGELAVDVDPDRFAQVVGNLLENASRFARSRIRVDLGTDGAQAWIAVTDDGAGIAPEDLPHVFERLYVARHHPGGQAPDVSQSGTGLGLAIVRELVTAMGGRVHAESQVGAGARFTVAVPRSLSPDLPRPGDGPLASGP